MGLYQASHAGWQPCEARKQVASFHRSTPHR
jgi:hypothetical protein